MGDDRRIVRTRPDLLGAVLCALLLAAPASAVAAAGDIGDACLADRTCHNGACAGGRCVPCGMPGQHACPSRDPNQPGECHLPAWGYEPLATASGTICINRNAKDCGHVGEPACDRDGRNGCYYGVPSASRRGVVCLACGDIGQACCTGTDRVCDTGSCQSGICRLDPAGAAKARAEEAALVDRFAQALVRCDFAAAAASVDAAEAEGLRQRRQDAPALSRGAERRARGARRLYERPGGECPRQRLDACTPLDAALAAYRSARMFLERARQRTECAATRKAIAAAIFDVGANELIAISAVEKPAAGKAVSASGPPTKKGIDPTPPGAHPCLDPSVKSDRGMTTYQRYSWWRRFHSLPQGALYLRLALFRRQVRDLRRVDRHQLSLRPQGRSLRQLQGQQYRPHCQDLQGQGRDRLSPQVRERWQGRVLDARLPAEELTRCTV